jgi:hypothetical protein
MHEVLEIRPELHIIIRQHEEENVDTVGPFHLTIGDESLTIDIL